MTPQFSLAHLTALKCSPPELVSIASEAGFDYVSIRMMPVTAEEEHYQLVTDRRLMRETKARLADSQVSVLDVELIRLDPSTEPESFLHFFEAGAELGARSIITQLPDSNRKRATDRFARLCELARPFDLTLDLEFPSWTETPDLKSAVEVLTAIKQDNAGLLIDTLHFDRSSSSLKLLKEIPKSWFHFVHLCDAPGIHPDTIEEIIHTARAARLFPGEGGINISAILEHIPNVPFSLEIPNERRLQEQGPLHYARQALEASRLFFCEAIEPNLNVRPEALLTAHQ